MVLLVKQRGHDLTLCGTPSMKADGWGFFGSCPRTIFIWRNLRGGRGGQCKLIETIFLLQNIIVFSLSIPLCILPEDVTMINWWDRVSLVGPWFLVFWSILAKSVIQLFSLLVPHPLPFSILSTIFPRSLNHIPTSLDFFLLVGKRKGAAWNSTEDHDWGSLYLNLSPFKAPLRKNEKDRFKP